jgi:hypothetical protein
MNIEKGKGYLQDPRFKNADSFVENSIKKHKTE